MDDYLRSDAPVVEALDRAWDHSRLSVRTRFERLRSRIFLLVQCAVAAGVGWWVATDVFHHPSPFFAPIVAVVCLGMSYGQRLRRVFEVAIGVAVGVFTADVFVHVAGSGPWQISAVVLVSMAIATLLDGSPVIVTQSAVQGIVIAALVASSRPGLRSLDRRAHRRRRRPRRGDRRAPGAAAPAPGRGRRGGAQDRGAAPARRGECP